MKQIEYHHLGVPNQIQRENEDYFEPCKMFHTNFDDNPYGIEWLRFEEGSPLPELVKTYPHLGFKVDDLDEAIKGEKILIEPNSPSGGVRVAFIEYKGAPVEFLEYDESEQIKDFPKLETARLRLRQFHSSDAETLLNLRSNPEVMAFMDTPLMKDLKEAKQSINQLSQKYMQHNTPLWVITQKNDFENQMIGYIGYIDYSTRHCRGEVCYVLSPEYWGKGMMREALKAVLNFGFDFMNLHSICANVSPSNTASIRLLEAFDFRKEAYFKENWFFNGQFVDTVIYSLLKKDLNINA